MKWLLVLLLLLYGTFAVDAKAILLPLTPEQGLSQGSVRDLHLDRHGFLSQVALTVMMATRLLNFTPKIIASQKFRLMMC